MLVFILFCSIAFCSHALKRSIERPNQAERLRPSPGTENDLYSFQTTKHCRLLHPNLECIVPLFSLFFPPFSLFYRISRRLGMNSMVSKTICFLITWLLRDGSLDRCCRYRSSHLRPNSNFLKGDSIRFPILRVIPVTISDAK